MKLRAGRVIEFAEQIGERIGVVQWQPDGQPQFVGASQMTDRRDFPARNPRRNMF
jgi:hypothetical protein